MIDFRFKDVPAGAWLKIGAVASACVWVPLWLLMGVFALFGANTVTAAGEQVHGLAALLVVILGAGVFVLFGAVAVLLGGLAARLVPPIANATITVRPREPD